MEAFTNVRSIPTSFLKKGEKKIASFNRVANGGDSDELLPTLINLRLAAVAAVTYVAYEHSDSEAVVVSRRSRSRRLRRLRRCRIARTQHLHPPLPVATPPLVPFFPSNGRRVIGEL